VLVIFQVKSIHITEALIGQSFDPPPFHPFTLFFTGFVQLSEPFPNLPSSLPRVKIVFLSETEGRRCLP